MHTLEIIEQCEQQCKNVRLDNSRTVQAKINNFLQLVGRAGFLLLVMDRVRDREIKSNNQLGKEMKWIIFLEGRETSKTKKGVRGNQQTKNDVRIDNP